MCLHVYIGNITTCRKLFPQTLHTERVRDNLHCSPYVEVLAQGIFGLAQHTK